MVICEHISKSYGEVKALQDINLELKSGEIFGLIGPDGAGKTTLFRILTTLIKPDEGFASVNNLNVVDDFKEIRKIIGYMPGKFSLYQDLTVEENINFFATVFNTTLKENYHLVKEIYSQIEPFKDRKAGKLSGGMKQKLALSCALIHKPVVLFLDEPTTGVDPVSRKEFWDMLARLKAMGISILVSTPYMDEALMCDRIALIQDGKFLTVDSPHGIIKNFDKQAWAVKAAQMPKLLRDLRKYKEVVSVYAFGDAHHLITRNLDSVSNLKDFLEKQGHTHIGIERIEPGIEDCFMDLSPVENE